MAYGSTSSYLHEEFPGGLAEAFLSDNRIPELYLALNSMDRAAAQALVASVPLKTLADQYASALSLYSAALALNGASADVPGGTSAAPIWEALSGASPASPAAFFTALLRKDDGRLIAFFYTLSQIDTLHQRFFTRSVERTKRFYELFRTSAEMKRAGERKMSTSSFVEFLREVPLNADLSVDFPGAPEVWMVAKGKNISGSSVAKLTKHMKRKAAPNDEDEILIRLADTGYKSENRQQTELANFIAVTRIDAERDEPLTPESALLLAQGFATYGGLFPYFAELGNLDATDYKKAFSRRQTDRY